MKSKCYRTKTLLSSSLFILSIAVSGCGDNNYITPPTETWGNSLNTVSAEMSPQFSSNGNYLVFTSDRQNQRSVLLYELPNRRIVNLPGLNKPNSMQYQPDISDDGRYIVYVSEERGKPDIFIYDRLEVKSKNITTNFRGEVRNPTISGDGSFVGFEFLRNGQWDIEIYQTNFDVPLSLPSQN